MVRRLFMKRCITCYNESAGKFCSDACEELYPAVLERAKGIIKSSEVTAKKSMLIYEIDKTLEEVYTNGCRGI